MAQASIPMDRVPDFPVKRRRANWLLRVLILVSVAAHSVIFLHISGLYRSKALTAIELTLKEPKPPQVRDIPRPRLRPKNPPPPSPIKTVKAVRRPVPKLRAMKLAPVDPTAPDSLVETIEQPQTPDIAAPTLAGWAPPENLADTGEFGTARDYLDMVRLRIESKKQYPVNARARQIEGKVTVRFTIGRNGDVRKPKYPRVPGSPCSMTPP